MTTIQERVSRLEASQNRLSRLEGAQEHVASKADVAESKGELKAEMRAMELRITLRLGGLMVALAGLIIAIQRFL